MDKKTDTVELIVDLVNTTLDIQDLYLRESEYSQLSMSEMHVIEAVSKEEVPSMTAVANHLNITLGTLTTAVKKIIEKGFLVKERSNEDKRIFYLRLTKEGEKALEVHNQFHKELAYYIKSHIPQERMDWVYETIKLIYSDLIDYRSELRTKKKAK
ncbi:MULTISPECIES: MarR family winged helix-turn-helix transcriptional regulator [Coprobacillaceae]|uniref:MarR family winged helix-turn-helix transcriptional regulator n=1 Tax=Coprobacillaceae TaxID=2810280 RepID=UPI000E4BE4F5|nr:MULTISPECIES: MarR family transcriptional regulator [Coprobacillaceae]RHM60861.1 MarR family transcriptional regulator [Coprobacillus sp. AF33-1AC]RHS94524.1 MarR family transcriptional regulator [Erysipelatoclostridium sp. AM42-17]